MSCAKPTAGLIIDMLISEGKIDEDAPITKYLTDFKGTDWDGITTGDVLDMATRERVAMKDAYTSIEHILIALADSIDRG